MYRSYQKHAYDHTCSIVSVWSKNPVKNPYRHDKRKPMTPAELHAMQKAIERRNQKRGG